MDLVGRDPVPFIYVHTWLKLKHASNYVRSTCATSLMPRPANAIDEGPVPPPQLGQPLFRHAARPPASTRLSNSKTSSLFPGERPST